MLYLKTLLFVILGPGTVTVGVPYLLLVSGMGRFEMGALRWLGIIPLVLGGFALVWCVWDFARLGRGTPAPIDPPKVVIQRGLYRFVRNPMYVGVLSILLGETLLFQSLSLLMWTTFMGLMFHTFVVFYEEPALMKKFGKSYEDYRKTVSRWVPRLRG